MYSLKLYALFDFVIELSFHFFNSKISIFLVIIVKVNVNRYSTNFYTLFSIFLSLFFSYSLSISLPLSLSFLYFFVRLSLFLIIFLSRAQILHLVLYALTESAKVNVMGSPKNKMKRYFHLRDDIYEYISIHWDVICRRESTFSSFLS